MWLLPLIGGSLLVSLLGFVHVVVAKDIRTVRKDHGILKRQTTDGSNSILNQVPEGCRATCGPIDTILTGCVTPLCVCTDPNYIALKICMDCVVDYGTGTPTSDELRSRGQAVLSNFGSDCLAQGVHITQVMLNPSPAPGPPGGDAVSAIPTIATRSFVAGTASSTGGPRVGGNENSAAAFAGYLSLVSAAIAVFSGSALVELV